jgi:phosphoribosyl 1,2-cyclic phosphodiesterase
MVEIVFIGTGGGRINLLLQLRGTGGFRINSKSANIHVDPGPGALVNSIRFKQKPLKLDALIVTHPHIDHCNDANVMIEGISRHALKKRGILIVSKNTIRGGNRMITSYHQGKIEEIYEAKEGKKKKFKTKKGEFEIEITKAKHDLEDAFGFKLFIDGKTIGYTGDTEYYNGIGRRYEDCDYLVVNCMKPAEDPYSGHMTTDDVIRLLKEAKPGLAVITHMGMKMLRAGPKKEAEKITKKSGVKTVAAYDGMKV